MRPIPLAASAFTLAFLATAVMAGPRSDRDDNISIADMFDTNMSMNDLSAVPDVAADILDGAPGEIADAASGGRSTDRGASRR